MTIQERNLLIMNHLSLAHSLAWDKFKETPKCIQIDELKAAAYLGLVEAASRYNASFGVSFGFYARPRIQGEICDYLRELKWKFHLESRDLQNCYC